MPSLPVPVLALVIPGVGGSTWSGRGLREGVTFSLDEVGRSDLDLEIWPPLYVDRWDIP